jgi:hypothetical protein
MRKMPAFPRAWGLVTVALPLGGATTIAFPLARVYVLCGFDLGVTC